MVVDHLGAGGLQQQQIQETPMDTLRRVGIRTPSWGPSETLTDFHGAPEWEYRIKALAHVDTLPLAHLIADGWRVRIRPSHAGLYIQIRKDNR